MPRNKQGGMKRKKHSYMAKESPFPIPMSTSPGEPASGQWSYYTGYIEGSAVVVKHSGDMEFLYKMGFFGKGTLSRGLPNFHERNHRVRVEMPQKHDHHKSVQAAVVNKRSYLIHRRYKALADGRTKEYNDVVHHEEQQQGFVDSTDEEMDDDSTDASSSSSDDETAKMIAFKLLNTSDSTNEVPLVSGYSAGVDEGISGKVRSNLVSILAEVSLLSNEQITSFLRVPQDMKQLTEKFKKLRMAEIRMLKQMYSAQFPGRHFKQGEVITLDEDDSAVSENETENAVVISDSDEADGENSEKTEGDNTRGTGFLSREKRGDKKAVNAKYLAGGSPKKKLTDWASDDESNFWADGVGVEKATGPEDSEDKEVQDTDLRGEDGGKKEDETSSDKNQEQTSSDKNQEQTSSDKNQEQTVFDQNKKQSGSDQNQEPSICRVEKVDEMKIDEMETDVVQISTSVQAAENPNSPNSKHQNVKGKKKDAVDIEENNKSLSSVDENDIDVPDVNTAIDISAADKGSVDNDSSDSKVDGKETDDTSKNDNSRLQSKSGDVCSMDASKEEEGDGVCSLDSSMGKKTDGDCSISASNEEKGDAVCSLDSSMEKKAEEENGVCSMDTSSQKIKPEDEALKTTSSISQESSHNSLDISSETNIPKTIEDTLVNTSDIVKLPKEQTDLSMAAEHSSETVETSSIDCKNSNITDSISTPEVINLNDDKQVSFGNDILEPLAKDEKMPNNNTSNIDGKPTENVPPANITVVGVDDSENILSNPDDGVTNIESDNSNDSDDVICIESKSAEPNKLHHFLSQTTKKVVIPVITKSVTFMSSITEVPTFVCASVGFQTWGPVLHFNFTGDASHLPTVMSVSPTSSSGNEQPPHNGHLQNSNTVYERIYPPIKSLVPHANSTGAIIKQRLRGLPCLSSAYLKVSQSHGLSHTLSQNGTTHSKNYEGSISKHSQSNPKPHSNTVSKHRQQTRPSTTQKSFQSDTSGKPLSLSSGSSSDSPKLTFSHVGCYMKAFQTADKFSESDDHDTQILQRDTDGTGNSSNTFSLSAIISKLEKLYNSTFPKEKTALDENAEKPGPEIDNLLTEFHTALNNYLPSVEISTMGEYHVLNLLLSKSDNHTDILSESSNEAKSNLSIFQTWLLEKRYEYCERLQKTNSNQDINVNVGLDLNSENKAIVSQPEVESEMIVDADLTENSVNKQSSSVTHTQNYVNNLNAPVTNVKNSEANLNEDRPIDEPTLLDKTLKNSQKALETENRKRIFDRSEEGSEESVKMKKLNEDELLLDNEDDNNVVSSCRREQEARPKEEDMLTGGDSFSEQLEGEPKTQVDAEAPATIVEAAGSGILKSVAMEKLGDKTSGSCELISGQDSVNIKRLGSEKDDDSVQDDVSVSMEKDTGCSEDKKSTPDDICKEITPMEVEDSKQVETTKNTSSHGELQQLSGDDFTSRQLAEDELMAEDDKNSLTLSKSLSRNGPDSDSPKPENKNIEDTNKSTSSKEEEHGSSKVDEIPSSESTTYSKFSPKEKQNGNLVNTEDSSGNRLAEGGTKPADVTPNCKDTSSQDGIERKSANSSLTKDLDSKKSITSSTCNTQSDPSQSDETAEKDSSHNAGASEDFQICIGSSSDEDSEPHTKTKKLHHPTLDGVHPYSARDDPEGDLFVVPNTSDEDYEGDALSEAGDRGNKKQRQVWRPCAKKDPYPTEERLHLMLEEAFFLSFGLGCLKILDPEMKMLNLTQMWQQFNVLKEQFIPHYVAYHYFRSKGWVPKSGLKFGCDLILYRDGPPFYHGSYSVVVTVVKDTTLLPVHRNGGISFDQRKLNWISLAGLNRITEHVAKELMLCYVIWPGDLTHEESLSPECLSRFKVKEVVVSRWVSSQGRENKIEEEEEIP